jgi:hypothetical protein
VLLLSLACLFSTPLMASNTEAVPLDKKVIATESSYPTPNSPLNQSTVPATSAADLSLIGILALGIIGLLWVRRHTSEL